MIDESQRLHHLTLNTGDLSTPRLDGIDPTALGITESWLRELVASPGLPLPVLGPGEHGYDVIALRSGSTLLQTVYGPSGAPLVTFGVAPAPSHDAKALWVSLAQLYLRSESSAEMGLPAMPLCPWCAVVIHPSAALHMDALRWLGDYERCVALAWLRIIETQTTRSP